MNKQMDRIERAFREVADALKVGQFTRSELEGIKMFADHVSTSTDRALGRGPVSPAREENETPDENYHDYE